MLNLLFEKQHETLTRLTSFPTNWSLSQPEPTDIKHLSRSQEHGSSCLSTQITLTASSWPAHEETELSSVNISRDLEAAVLNVLRTHQVAPMQNLSGPNSLKQFAKPGKKTLPKEHFKVTCSFLGNTYYTAYGYQDARTPDENDVDGLQVGSADLISRACMRFVPCRLLIWCGLTKSLQIDLVKLCTQGLQKALQTFNVGIPAH